EVRECEDPGQRGGEPHASVPTMAEDNGPHERARAAEPDQGARGDERAGRGGGGVEERTRDGEHGEGADGAARAMTVEEHAHRKLDQAEREKEGAVGHAERLRREREVARKLGGDSGEGGAVELADGSEGGEESDDTESGTDRLTHEDCHSRGRMVARAQGVA